MWTESSDVEYYKLQNKRLPGGKNTMNCLSVLCSLNVFISGYFATDVEAEEGDVFALYFFQMSFATTATTIVSGAMAERTHLHAYTFFSFTNTISYVFPAHWIWGEKGFLKEMGVIDYAGKNSKSCKSPIRLIFFSKMSRRLGRMIRSEGLGSHHVFFLRRLPLSKSRASSEGHF